MSQVFISYRQTDDTQIKRVRAFAERLRDAGIDVVLDQFFLDDNPAGPDDGWPKWSSDRALKTDYVIIIGTSEWYECFEGTQRPGTGLGSACEAGDIRTRIYKAANVTNRIRVVLFVDGDDEKIPDKLSPYHRFGAESDFESIVRWLGGTNWSGAPLRTSIPHNLPSLQPFFGREDELRKIAEALDPESRTWGVLIDGPGGMGKTSLAVHAAYDAPPNVFDKIVFVSLQSRELDDDGVRDLSGFLISGLAELLNELARELGHTDLAKAPEEQRPRTALDALRGTRTLLVLDNLESLLKPERDIIFNFVKRLPPGCKAILTSRERIGTAVDELILGKLSETAALATLAKLAESNPALANTDYQQRMDLYRETSGNPLLLRWTAGQIGRGSCLTSHDAIEQLRSCSEGNDPLEFILGELVEHSRETEMRVVCVLTYFTLPAKVQHIAEIAERSEADTNVALGSLINRSLVLPSEEPKTFTVVPLVADFLRKKKKEVMEETGDRIERNVYALVTETGHLKSDHFSLLDAAWPKIAAALPRFVAGPNDRLQKINDALSEFLNFTGRWDEWLALSRDAESCAIVAKDFLNAGWRAVHVGWVYHLLGQSTEVLAAADRADAHWQKAQVGVRERAIAIRLRGIGYKLNKDYKAAIAAHQDAVKLWSTLSQESDDVAIGLNALAGAEHCAGYLNAAERDYREALRIARVIDDREGLAIYTGNLAELELDRGNWVQAEVLAREALRLSEQLGRLELIGLDTMHLAMALVRHGKKFEALPHAERSVKILTQLNLADRAKAIKILNECKT